MPFSTSYRKIADLSRSMFDEDVELRVVEREVERGDLLLEARRHDRPEAVGLGLSIEEARVDAVRRRRDAQEARIVGRPSGDVARILRNLDHLPRVDVDSVDVEELRVSLVHRDQHLGRVVLENVDDLDAHLLERGQVLWVRAIDIDRVEAIVLVSTLIQDVDDPLVSLPGVAGDVPGRRLGDTGCGLLADLLDVHVQPALPGLEERQVSAVGGELEVDLLRVAEEVLHRDERSFLRPGERGRAEGGQDDQRSHLVRHGTGPPDG